MGGNHSFALLAARAWLISHTLSGLVSNSIAEILGRKKSLIIDCFAFLIGYSLYSIGGDMVTLCVARAFLGYPLVNTVSHLEERIKNTAL